MKKLIEACLWFCGVVFSLAGDLASFIHWEKTNLVLTGISAVIFAYLTWFYFWGQQRVKDQAES